MGTAGEAGAAGDPFESSLDIELAMTFILAHAAQTGTAARHRRAQPARRTLARRLQAIIPTGRSDTPQVGGAEPQRVINGTRGSGAA